MRHLRHQPLLVWTLSLVLLLGVVAVGLGDERREPVVDAAPLAVSGYPQARAMLEELPGVHAAIATSDLETWSEQMNDLAAAGREADDGTVREKTWDLVISGIEDVVGAGAGDEPALVLAELEDLGSAIMRLVSSY